MHSPTWYHRRRTLVSLVFLLMVVLTLFVQSGLADGVIQNFRSALQVQGIGALSVDVQTVARTPQFNGNASQHLTRISQLDPKQYASNAEWNTWAYSACSAAAMTEIFDAYGLHLRITDVLNPEARIGEVTPSLGLVRPEGIANTAALFGFKTNWGNAWSLDQIIATANTGKPVIVSFPPDRYAGGHILVVIGGDSSTVSLADTSLWNRHAITRAQFLAWWEGFGAVVTPR